MANTNSSGGNEWNEADSAEFLDWGRYFVPDRESQIETFCQLVATTAVAGDFVDLCCGEGVLSRALLDRFPNRRVHGFDGSPRMLQSAADLIDEYHDRFVPHSFELADKNWRAFQFPVAAVVSSLALHHLDGSQKLELFRDLAASLLPGGVFVIADIVQPAGRWGASLATTAWDAVVRQRSLTLDGDLRGFDQFRRLNWNCFCDANPDPVDKPSPLRDQLDWLEAAGFIEVDVFWMLAGHAIFGGRKPLGGASDAYPH